MGGLVYADGKQERDHLIKNFNDSRRHWRRLIRRTLILTKPGNCRGQKSDCWGETRQACCKLQIPRFARGDKLKGSNGIYCPARIGETTRWPAPRFLPSPLSCW